MDFSEVKGITRAQFNEGFNSHVDRLNNSDASIFERLNLAEQIFDEYKVVKSANGEEEVLDEQESGAAA